MPKLHEETEEYLLVAVCPGKAIQSGQKGAMCAFYAEKYIIPFRKSMLESKHSAIRKTITLAAEVYTELVTIIEENTEIDLYTYLKKTKDYLSTSTTTEPHSSAVLTELTQLLNTFQKPIDKNTVIEWLKKRCEEKERTAIQPLFTVSLDTLWDKVEGAFEKKTFYQLCWHKKRREDRGISVSFWHPSDGFSELLKEIKQKGPLIAGGYFGIQFFSINPNFLGSLAHYALYLFPSFPIKKDYPLLHFIVLIGGHKKNKWLYYLDPSDGYRKNQFNRLFLIPYDTFLERYQNPYGLMEGDLTTYGIKPGRYLLRLSKCSIFAIKNYEKPDLTQDIQTLLNNQMGKANKITYFKAS